MHALEGLRIVDFGNYLAGPYAARVLGDLGADVIKVDRPGGGDMDTNFTTRLESESFDANKGGNYSRRGMRAIIADLKKPKGLEVVQRLIATADVVGQNMRPGVADRLGIGYKDVQRLNPRAIFLFSPGYGAVGPRAHYPSFEPLNSAFVGIHYRSGGKGNPPVNSISLDAFCGLVAACGVMMALLDRQKTGLGQYLDVSQMACAMYYTSETYKTADGQVGPLPELDQEQMGVGPLDRLYRSSDDFLCICCEKDREFAALCTAMELRELLEDPRFRSEEDRAANGGALAGILTQRFKERTTQEWFDLLDSHGAPCEIPVLNGEERLLQNPAHVESGLVAEYQHPIWGVMREIGNVVRLSETPGRVRRWAPRVGEHTQEILEELGYTPKEIEELRKSGAVTPDPRLAAAERSSVGVG